MAELGFHFVIGLGDMTGEASHVYPCWASHGETSRTACDGLACEAPLQAFACPKARNDKGLLRKAFVFYKLVHFLGGSPTWARTRDLRINSPALYRLSYRGKEPPSIALFSALRQRASCTEA